MERILIEPGAEIVLGRGLFDGSELLPARVERARAAVITQPGAARWGRRVARRLRGSGLEAAVRVVPDGEAAKTLAVVEETALWLNEIGFTRDDSIVGVGGGSVTDLAGFVAAVYLRGVEAVHVPTTLLAAVDGAIGGKSGVNVVGKNLIGAFAHPARVVIDFDVLEALPAALWADGAAEALKAGFVGDPVLVELLEEAGTSAPIEEMVRRAVTVKVALVQKDLEDRGRRNFLNFGHTIGHAVEVACKTTHGQAVAVGMVAAAAASAGTVGFTGTERVKAAVARLGLPLVIEAGGEAVRPLIELDKKRDRAGLRMVLLRDIGDPVVAHVDDATVKAALDAVAAP